MRKRQLGQTRRGKSRIAPWAAHQRTEKGWRTKRQHGLFSHPDAPLNLNDVEPGENDDIAAHGRTRPNDRSPLHHFTPEELGPEGTISVESLAKRRAWEADQFASNKTITEEYMELLTGTHLTPQQIDERNKFLVQVERRKRAIALSKQPGRALPDAMVSRTEPANIDKEAFTVETVGRQRLHSVINKDTSKRGVIRGMSRGAARDSGDKWLPPEHKAQSDRLEAEGKLVEAAHYRKKHEQTISAPGEEKQVTPEQVRDRVVQIAVETFQKTDPITGHAAILTDPKRVKAWAQHVIDSHFAPTEAERNINRHHAERLANQLVQDASRRSKARHRAASLSAQDNLLAHAQALADIQNQEAQGRAETDVVPFGVAKAQLKIYEGMSDEIITKEAERSKIQHHINKVRKNQDPSIDKKDKDKVIKTLEGREKKLAEEIAYHHSEVKRWKNIARQEPRIVQERREKAHEKALSQLFLDPRLGDTRTVEQLYAEHDHETAKPLARARHEFAKVTGQVHDRPDPDSLQRMSLRELRQQANKLGVESSGLTKSQLSNALILSGSEAPKWFARARAWHAFNSTVLHNKVDNFREGNLTIGFNDRGITNPEDATVRISPNKVWAYDVQDKTNPLAYNTVTTDYWNKDPKFLAVEKGDGRVKNAYELRRQRSSVALDVGERTRADKNYKLESAYSREIFIPVAGAKAASRIVDDPNPTNRTVRQIREAGSPAPLGNSSANLSPGPPPASLAAVQWTDIDTSTPEGLAKWEAADPEGGRQEIPVQRKMKVTVIDPKELKLLPKSRVDLGVVLPPDNGFGTLGQINLEALSGRKTAHLGDLATKFHDTRSERVRRETTSREISRPIDEQIRKLDSEFAMRQQDYARNALAPDFPGGEEMRAAQEDEHHKKRNRLLKELGAAAATSAYYGSQERVRKGYIPNFINNRYSGFLEGHPRAAIKARTWGLPTKEVFTDVNQAWIKPGLHNVANFPHRLQHPFMSESGTTLGVDWGTTINRKGPVSRFIPTFIPGFRPEDASHRELGQIEDQIQTITNTEKLVGHVYQKGFKSRWIQHRVEPVLNWQPYKHFYDQAGEPAGQAYDASSDHWVDLPGTGRDGLLAEATRKARTIRNTYPEGSEVRVHAEKVIQSTERLRAEHLARKYAGDNHYKSPMQSMPNHLALVLRNDPPSRLTRWSHGDINDVERNVAIAGGVAATAVGAAYLYHRHLEKKRHEIDPNYQGTKFYNDLIPGPIDLPAPHLRTTGHWAIPDNNLTREFSLANKKVPVEFGASVRRHNVWKGSPADRGYETNAKLIGGIKNERPSGSFMHSLFFDAAAPRRRSWVPGGGQLVLNGHKLPIRAEIGARKKVELSRTNPNRLTQEGRDNVLWAFGGSEHQGEVMDFYSHGKTDKLIDMFNDPSERARVNRQKGTREVEETRKRRASPNINVKWIRAGQETPTEETFPKIARAQKYVRFDEGPASRSPGGVYPEVPWQPTEGDFVHPRVGATPEQILKQNMSMHTGGTRGSHPYSQIGQERDPISGRRMKYETVFHAATNRDVLIKRPVGSRRTNVDREEFRAADVNSPGNRRIRSNNPKKKTGP